MERNAGKTAIPQEALFIDFAKNWRQFITTSPELALPVVRNRQQPSWQPQVFSECVFSPDAGGNMPEVTLIWNEPGEIIEGPRVQQQAPAAPPAIRFDVGLHQDAFARNYFSSALATDKLKRFNIPSNAALVNDTAAVILTGPGLFPKLMDFKSQSIQDRDTKRQFTNYAVVLRDLNQGATYTIRASQLAGNKWINERQFAFTTPVCPTSF